MKKSWIFLFALAFLCSGCVRHIPVEYILPTATQGKVIIKSGGSKSAENPWLICREQGNSDKIETAHLAELKPQGFRVSVMNHLGLNPETGADVSVAQRCANGQVYVCNLKENPLCMEKVDITTEPTEAMRAFCESGEHENGMLPVDVTMTNTAYVWQCKNGKPTITTAVLIPDEQGYDNRVWVEVPGL